MLLTNLQADLRSLECRIEREKVSSDVGAGGRGNLNHHMLYMYILI